MNKPDSNNDVKTYYSYDLPENKKMIVYIKWIGVATSCFAALSLIFLFVYLKSLVSVCLSLMSLLIFGCLAFYVWSDYKKVKDIFNSEPVVTHTWGVETIANGLRADIKWNEISSLESSNIRFCFFWNLNKYALVYKSGTFYFYDIIENVKFLENFIRKNIKSFVDAQNEVKWVKK